MQENTDQKKYFSVSVIVSLHDPLTNSGPIT